MRKPRVLTRCVAAVYAAPQERIIEFAFPGGAGGLISFKRVNGKDRLEVYRVDGEVDIIAPTSEASELRSAMQWLLDDMNDAGETHDPKTGGVYDSVEHAAAALVEAGGTLSWYSRETAAAYRRACDEADKQEG